MNYNRLYSLAALTVLPITAQAAVTFSYIFDDRLNSGDPLNDDGWSSAGSNWITAGFGGELFARNDVSGTVDRRIVRANDSGFNFSIPEDTTELELTIKARTGSNFWEAGLSDGNANVLGIGGDFEFNNRYYVLDGTTRRNETGFSAFGDQLDTLSLRYDLVAGTASLVLNPGGANDVLRTEIPLAVSATDIQNADGLFIRADSAFAAPSSFTITAVPEVSTVLYASFAALAVLTMRRSRKL